MRKIKWNLSLIIFLCIGSSNIINFINSKIITEGYHFFDIFYYKDLYKNLISQKKDNKCSIEDGPSCYYIKNEKENEIISELKHYFTNHESFIKDSPENIYTKLKETLKVIRDKDDKEIEEDVYSFDAPYMVQLYLTFESYDEKTKYTDIYAPETIDNQYESGRLTLTISGKLRLSQKNAEKYESKIVSSLREEGPRNTYAYVESKEVIFKFSSKSSIISLYIKKNKFNIKNKNFYLYGYRNGRKQIITKVENVPSDRWVKVTGNGKKYDYIGLIRGFDYDNLVINAVASRDYVDEVNQITKKYSTVLNEKINGMITDILNGIKTGDIKTNTNLKDIGNIKVVKVDINQNEIVEETEEDFDIPEEIMNEINKIDNNKISGDNYKNENENKINKNKKEQNMNKQDL